MGNTFDSELKGKLEEAGEVYSNICIHNAESKLRTFEDWKQDRQEFYQHYQDAIEAAISYYYQDGKWQLKSSNRISRMLDAYIWDNGLDMKMTTGESREERERKNQQSQDNETVKKVRGRKQTADLLGEDITKRNKDALNKNSKSDQKYDLSEGNEQELKHDNLSADQMKGLQDISRWLYRNVDDTGLLGDSAYEFVHLFVEKQPARLKLLAYYLVEKKRRKAPDISDIYFSQTSYVPNLEEFKNQMIATKFKFWKRVDGSHIYWDKLGESMRIAINAQGVIASFASLAEMEQKESQGASNTDKQSPADTQPPATEEQQIEEAAKNRRIYYAKVVRCGFELADMIREQDAEEKKEKKEALSKQIHDKGNEFRECYMKMREADSTLVSLGRETDESRAGEKNIQGDNEVSADDTKTMTAAGYIELGADALDYAASGFEKFESVEKIGWNIAQADISILNKISMVTSSASFVTSFVSSIVTLCDWVNHSNRVSTSECLLKAADLFSSVVSFAESGHGMAMAAKGWKDMANFTLEAVSDANAVSMGIASAVTGGVNMGVGIVQTGVGLHRIAGVKSTQKKLKEQKNMTQEDRDTTEAMLALQGRVANEKATAGAFQTVVGALEMTGGILNAAGVTAIAGEMVLAAATLVSIAGSIVKYFQNKSNLNTTIDDYLQTEKYLVPIMNKIREEYNTLKTERKARNQSKLKLIEENKKKGSSHSGVFAKEEREEPESAREKMLKQQMHDIGSRSLREQIRVQAAALAGYASKESFYDKIVGDYARFLYEKVFYQDGKLILADSEEAKHPTEPRAIYVKMLHNSGLKPAYPTKDTGKPKPSVENISRQLRI